MIWFAEETIHRKDEFWIKEKELTCLVWSVALTIIIIIIIIIITARC